MNLTCFNRGFYFLSVLSFSLISCVKLLDVKPPVHISQNVLVGIINPDSLIKVRIFKTLPSIFKENNYVGLDNLEVFIFEDRKEKIVLKSIGNGYYSAQTKPKSGHIYNIEAIIDEKNSITAEDSIPILNLPLISLTNPKPENFNSNPDLILTKNIETNCFWWFSLNFIKKGIDAPQTLLSDSPNLDIFNSTLNNIDGRRDYYLITRIKPEMPINKTINVGFVNSIKNMDSAYINISCLSPTYDKYLKTAITSYQNSIIDNQGDLKNPFGDFLPVYSNVKNGLGIFVGYSSKKVVLK